MSEIDRFRPDDCRGVDTLYRRTYGADAAEAIRLRWDWQHRRNPYNPTGQPGIWVAREGPTVVGQYPTLPVRLSLKGLEVEGAWGAGAMIAPERDRQGLDEALIRAWDRNSGAVLAFGPSEQPRGVIDRLHWPPSRVVPSLVKPLTRRAVRVPSLPTPFNRLISALMYPVVQVVSRSGPCAPNANRFDDSTTRSPRYMLTPPFRTRSVTRFGVSVESVRRSGAPATRTRWRHGKQVASVAARAFCRGKPISRWPITVGDHDDPVDPFELHDAG